MSVGPWAVANSAIGAYCGYKSWEAYLRAHGAPDDEPEVEEYTPAVNKIDWQEDTKSALRQARIGAALLLAFVAALAWALVDWLA